LWKKTGTAENFAKSMEENLTNDHSIFVAFGFKRQSKIASSRFSRNGYWGNRFAGPIATLMIEKYPLIM
jgi:penicillin-binding protein 2